LQGMSYLHTRHILHKDLRSKNIFISERKAIKITDFGIFNVKRLSYPKRYKL
jgi:serine/threonine protein kinase